MNLDDLRAENLPPDLRSARLRFRLELADGGSQDLDLRDGRLTLAAEERTPDVKLTNVPADWMSVVDGRVNLLTAVMRGDIGVRGSVSAAFLLYLYGRHAGAGERAA